MSLETIFSQLAEHETLFKLVATKEELHRFHITLHALREEIELLKRRKEKEIDRILQERAKEVLRTIVRNKDVCTTIFT